MKTFREFLQEHAGQVRAEVAANESIRNLWISSTESLIDRMKTWLGENDPEQLLKLEDRVVELSEESIGTYNINALTIRLGKRVVDVEPIAFEVMGPKIRPSDDGSWKGRVDIIGNPFVYKIYRFLDKNGKAEWWIYDKDDLHIRPFNHERFEAALVGLFS